MQHTELTTCNGQHATDSIPGGYAGMVYMPTANLFVSADANGAVNVWDFRTSARLQELDGPTSEVAPPWHSIRQPARGAH